MPIDELAHAFLEVKQPIVIFSHRVLLVVIGDPIFCTEPWSWSCLFVRPRWHFGFHASSLSEDLLNNRFIVITIVVVAFVFLLFDLTVDIEGDVLIEALKAVILFLLVLLILLILLVSLVSLVSLGLGILVILVRILRFLFLWDKL